MARNRRVSPHYGRIAEAIKRERFSRNMKAPELAQLAGVSLPTLYKRLAKPHEMPVGQLLQLCQALEIDPVELIGRVMEGVK